MIVSRCVNVYFYIKLLALALGEVRGVGTLKELFDIFVTLDQQTRGLVV